jgi:hypothetical protein
MRKTSWKRVGVLFGVVTFGAGTIVGLVTKHELASMILMAPTVICVAVWGIYKTVTDILFEDFDEY